MSLLRATVRNTADWWEIKLIDLDVRADGTSEADMLRELEHAIKAEYHLAVMYNKVPFAGLLQSCPVEVSESWEKGDKKLKILDLPVEVRHALSAVFHRSAVAQFPH